MNCSLRGQVFLSLEKYYISSEREVTLHINAWKYDNNDTFRCIFHQTKKRKRQIYPQFPRHLEKYYYFKDTTKKVILEFIEMDLLGRTSVVLILISKQKVVLAPYSYGKFLMGYAKVDISDYAKSISL